MYKVSESKIYRFADFNVEVQTSYFYFHKYYSESLSEFLCDSTSVDFKIFSSEKSVEFEKEIAEDTNHAIHYYEGSSVARQLAEELPLHGAFVLHSACFDVDGVGVAFAAHSGTGKTTHMRLWQELLGDKMTIVNGDKPIVRFFDTEPEVPYAYGTPWCGKENLGCNMRTPMKHICFIERAEENSCEPMDASEAIDLIFNQVYMPKDPMAVVNTMQLINRFISSCKLWKIKCNMDISAAKVAYKAIFPEG